MDVRQESAEELLTAGLLFRGGVVVLGLQGWLECDAGLEEGAVLADGFEGTVEFGGAGAGGL